MTTHHTVRPVASPIQIFFDVTDFENCATPSDDVRLRPVLPPSLPPAAYSVAVLPTGNLSHCPKFGGFDVGITGDTPCSSGARASA